MTDLSMYRGDDRQLTITASEELTGSEIRWTAKWSRHVDAEAIIEKSTLDGSIVIGDPATTATVSIDAADTVDLTPGPLRWDIEITDGTGKVRTVAAGRLIVMPDVTTPVGS